MAKSFHIAHLSYFASPTQGLEAASEGLLWLLVHTSNTSAKVSTCKEPAISHLQQSKNYIQQKQTACSTMGDAASQAAEGSEQDF